MFSSSTEEGVKLFLRANETVHVPFKFQSFTSFNATPEMVSLLTFLTTIFVHTFCAQNLFISVWSLRMRALLGYYKSRFYADYPVI